jgi:hypothetical protein
LLKINQTSFKKGHKLGLGKTHSDETKLKIGQNNFFKGKPAHNRKSVTQMDLTGVFIKNWDSAYEAADITNSQTSKIIACCRGKRNKHNNFKWCYNI